MSVSFILTVIFISTGFTENIQCVNLDSSSKKPSSAEQPPLVFPEDSTKYKIVSNKSPQLDSLLDKSSNASKSEIFDLLHAPSFEQTKELKDKLVYKNGEKSLSEEVTPKNKSAKAPDDTVNVKLDSELMQKVGAMVEKDAIKEDIGDAGGLGIQPGKLATMIAAIILAVATAAYVGMVLWRKSLEKKYGSRHMLVNEEETPNSFRHSSV